MSIDQYLIVSTGNQWLARLNASAPCTFARKDSVIHATVDAARWSGKIGIATAVVSSSKEGHFTPIWIFGRDACSAEA